MRPTTTVLLLLAAALPAGAAQLAQAPKPVQQTPSPSAIPRPAAQAAPITQAPAAAQATQATAKQAQDSAEQNEVRETLERLLSRVNESWFGSPYRDTMAMDIKGTLALAIKGGALDAKIEQLTQGAVKSPGVRSGQALCTLEGTYFANGDHIYNVTGDLGKMRFQRNGEKGYWYIQDQNVYSTAIDSMPKDAPVSYMGWFAGLMQDIKNVYAGASTFRASRGKDAKIAGRDARTLVFDAPTAAYDPKKREQAASDTFSFWKKGHMEIAYEEATMQPIRMEFSNAAQGVEATMSFRYNKDGRIQAIDISNKSKQWEGPGSVTASYGPDGRLSSVVGELTGPTHKIMFNVSTAWSGKKDLKTAAVPATAMKLGREDMELRLAMMFAGNIGDLQRGGFNFMAPKVAPAAQPARLSPATEAK
jgi:hypothetical protein